MPGKNWRPEEKRKGTPWKPCGKCANSWGNPGDPWLPKLQGNPKELKETPWKLRKSHGKPRKPFRKPLQIARRILGNPFIPNKRKPCGNPIVAPDAPFGKLQKVTDMPPMQHRLSEDAEAPGQTGNMHQGTALSIIEPKGGCRPCGRCLASLAPQSKSAENSRGKGRSREPEPVRTSFTVCLKRLGIAWRQRGQSTHGLSMRSGKEIVNQNRPGAQQTHSTQISRTQTATATCTVSSPSFTVKAQA